MGFFPVPVRKINKVSWGHLSHYGNVHEIIGLTFDLKQQNFPIAHNHRVRRYKVKGNVHWKIPEGYKVYDIKLVEKGQSPGRKI